MHRLILLFAALMPIVAHAEGITFEDAPCIAIPAGLIYEPQRTPMEEIRALADLDGDPTQTTSQEHEMIALLVQLLGAQPAEQ